MDKVRNLNEGPPVPIQFNLVDAKDETPTHTWFKPESIVAKDEIRILQGTIGTSINGKRLQATICYYFEKNIAYLDVQGI
jgi:hypothetical protein